jgi:hypothetical protein
MRLELLYQGCLGFTRQSNALTRMHSGRMKLPTVRSALHSFARQGPPLGTLIEPNLDVEVRRTGIVDCSARAAIGHVAAPPSDAVKFRRD